MATAAASIASLWRYPVKSMLGEEVDSSRVSERGLAGDRAFALIDVETGKLASAKQPRLWGRLLEFRARLPADGSEAVRITLPGGGSVGSDDPDVDEVLSRAIGRRVTLARGAPQGLTLEEYWPAVKGRVSYGQVVSGSAGGDAVIEMPPALAAPGTFFDFSAVHLITTAALERLRSQHAPGGVDVRRFRPNLVIEVPGASGFVENAWAGRTIAIGEGVRLRGIVPTMRCVMTTLAQDGLPNDPGVLRTLVQHNLVSVPQAGSLPCAGLYAVVLQGGAVRRGDRVIVD